MFWIGVLVCVLVILGLTWMGARLFDRGDAGSRREDREDRAVLPMHSDE